MFSTTAFHSECTTITPHEHSCVKGFSVTCKAVQQSVQVTRAYTHMSNAVLIVVFVGSSLSATAAFVLLSGRPGVASSVHCCPVCCCCCCCRSLLLLLCHEATFPVTHFAVLGKQQLCSKSDVPPPLYPLPNDPHRTPNGVFLFLMLSSSLLLYLSTLPFSLCLKPKLPISDAPLPPSLSRLLFPFFPIPFPPASPSCMCTSHPLKCLTCITTVHLAAAPVVPAAAAAAAPSDADCACLALRALSSEPLLGKHWL